MKCRHCSYEFNDSSYAYKSRQRCPKCGTIYQIHFPSGVGFIPAIISVVPALYMVLGLKFSILVGLSVFILFYWPIDIIMNIILIYKNQYNLEEIK